jgi:hypothetical protein
MKRAHVVKQSAFGPSTVFRHVHIYKYEVFIKKKGIDLGYCIPE